ncbi:hypothetical protein Q8G32_29020 [Priestia megaterium]|uniref:hypothetical protein n=1 Tax=Priestia megaterium TaxID=1404 RepID=UPI002730B411|nr:hypothetical protein [Priestia megaterium]MDP1471885.1 hypothetical protein [Priestia megaterium]
MSIDSIKHFLNIDWVSSIWTGLLCSVIVWVCQSIWGNKEYKRRVIEANKEILTILEACISEKDFPEIKILRSLHKSVAKNNLVKVKDIDTLDEILNELVRMIMASKFLSHSEKLDHSNRLLSLIPHLSSLHNFSDEVATSSVEDDKESIKKTAFNNLLKITGPIVAVVASSNLLFESVAQTNIVKLISHFSTSIPDILFMVSTAIFLFVALDFIKKKY